MAVAVAVALALNEAVPDEDVELSVASINTPPAIAAGEIVVAFLAAFLYAVRVLPVILGVISTGPARGVGSMGLTGD